MKLLIRNTLRSFLLLSISLTTSCSFSRSNLENAKNLEFQIKAFASDPTHSQPLIKAMEQSSTTFISQKEPQKALRMFEEVYSGLPMGPVPAKQIVGHALVKRYILEAYSKTAKSTGLEIQAIQFLESLHAAYDAQPSGSRSGSKLVNKYIESLKQATELETP